MYVWLSGFDLSIKNNESVIQIDSYNALKSAIGLIFTVRSSFVVHPLLSLNSMELTPVFIPCTNPVVEIVA